MNILAICNEKEEENIHLRNVSKEKIALSSEEKWDICEYQNVEEFQGFIEEEPYVEVAYVDAIMESGLSAAKEVRKTCQDASLVIIADEHISPMKYLKPDIQPQALLLRPLKEEETREVLGDLYHHLQHEKEKETDVFVMEERNQEKRIPFQKIAYFEAKNKKIYVIVENQEYGFYDTIANLEGRLPDYFVRCHRSYLVNSRKVKGIYAKKGEVELEHNIVLPLSRTYRKSLKERVK